MTFFQLRCDWSRIIDVRGIMYPEAYVLMFRLPASLSDKRLSFIIGNPCHANSLAVKYLKLYVVH